MTRNGFVICFALAVTAAILSEAGRKNVDLVGGWAESLAEEHEAMLNGLNQGLAQQAQGLAQVNSLVAALAKENQDLQAKLNALTKDNEAVRGSSLKEISKADDGAGAKAFPDTLEGISLKAFFPTQAAMSLKDFSVDGSPVGDVTAPDDVKALLGCPPAGVKFAWAKPESSPSFPLGGFVYMDEQDKVVGANFVCGTTAGCRALKFADAVDGSAFADAQRMTAISPLLSQVLPDATDFTWVMPTEEPMSNLGGYIYTVSEKLTFFKMLP